MLALALLVAGARAAPAAETDELYQATAIVTGTGEANRRLGLALCLEEVLVKVSGDGRLVGDTRVAALAKNAAALVASFSYRDRLAHRPINDEQGTRDRPYDLTVKFDPAKVDAALAALGRRPWTAARPRVVVFLGVHNGAVAYPLARDGALGGDQRDALAAAARRVALPFALPTQAALAAAGVGYESLAKLGPAELDGAAKAAGGDLALVGRLTWSAKALGWVAEWRLAADARAYRWRLRGVSFDDAFRNGMRGAAQILSSNGAPK